MYRHTTFHHLKYSKKELETEERNRASWKIVVGLSITLLDISPMNPHKGYYSRSED
jgi:hypothetical protein